MFRPVGTTPPPTTPATGLVTPTPAAQLAPVLAAHDTYASVGPMLPLGIVAPTPARVLQNVLDRRQTKGDFCLAFERTYPDVELPLFFPTRAAARHILGKMEPTVLLAKKLAGPTISFPLPSKAKDLAAAVPGYEESLRFLSMYADIALFGKWPVSSMAPFLAAGDEARLRGTSYGSMLPLPNDVKTLWLRQLISGERVLCDEDLAALSVILDGFQRPDGPDRVPYIGNVSAPDILRFRAIGRTACDPERLVRALDSHRPQHLSRNEEQFYSMMAELKKSMADPFIVSIPYESRLLYDTFRVSSMKACTILHCAARFLCVVMPKMMEYPPPEQIAGASPGIYDAEVFYQLLNARENAVIEAIAMAFGKNLMVVKDHMRAVAIRYIDEKVIKGLGITLSPTLMEFYTGVKQPQAGQGRSQDRVEAPPAPFQTAPTRRRLADDPPYDGPKTSNEFTQQAARRYLRRGDVWSRDRLTEDIGRMPPTLVNWLRDFAEGGSVSWTNFVGAGSKDKVRKLRGILRGILPTRES